MKSNSAAYDFIVVGGGSAGCVLAARLSENPSIRVCLIEAGVEKDGPSFSIPFLNYSLAGRPDCDWGIQTVSDSDPNNEGQPLAQARLLGGGGAVNAMIHSRGHSSEYNAWNCPGWDFPTVLETFKASESSDRGPSQWHGDRGPISVTRSTPLLPVDEAFLSASLKSSIPLVDDLNADPVEGLGFLDFAISNGRRCSSKDAYLQKAQSRSNLKVLLRSYVSRVIFKGDRAVGVAIHDDGKEYEILAGCEVILAAGAIQSPTILMRSGIGDESILAKNTIKVRVAKREVGQNLRNHFRFTLRYVSRQDVSAYRYCRPLGAAGAFLTYLTSRRGILAETAFSVGGTLKSSPNLKCGDIRITLARGLQGRRRGMFGLMPTQHGFMVNMYQGVPHSSGSVSIRPTDIEAIPNVRLGSLSDRRDLKVLSGCVDRVRGIMARESISKIVDFEVDAFGNLIRSPESLNEIELRIKKEAKSVFHPVGTCRMGMDNESVVDEKLRVRGVSGLRIADASIFPNILNANPNAAVMMVAERAAEFARCP